MIQTINFITFCDSFPESYKDNFSYEGKKALFDWIEDLENDLGEQTELDPIALCCEYSEYDSFEDIQKEYPNIKNIEDLYNNTNIIPIKGTYRLIIRSF